MGKVYIIGNGPSAIVHKLGKYIDAADVVVRINDFQTKGFEDKVGTKTDILFTCRLNEYLDNLDQFPEVILSLLMNPLDGVTIPDELINAPNITARIGWAEVNQMTADLGLRENCYPSTGLLCILKMIHRFGHVYVVGFDNFKNGISHYYGATIKRKPPRHDGERESEIMYFLNHVGLLTFVPYGPQFCKNLGDDPNLNP